MKKNSGLFDGNGPYALCILPGATVESLEEMAAKITDGQVRRGLPQHEGIPRREYETRKKEVGNQYDTAPSVRKP
jgi:hypothetical protein